MTITAAITKAPTIITVASKIMILTVTIPSSFLPTTFVTKTITTFLTPLSISYAQYQLFIITTTKVMHVTTITVRVVTSS